MSEREIEAIKKIDNAIQKNNGKELEKIYKKYKACDTDYKGKMIKIFLSHKDLNDKWKNQILHDLNDGKDKNENIYNAVSNFLGDNNKENAKLAWTLLYIDNPSNLFENFDKIKDSNLREQTINLYIKECTEKHSINDVYYDVLSHITEDEFMKIEEQIEKSDYFLAQIMLNKHIAYNTKHKLFFESGGVDPFILTGYTEKNNDFEIPDFVINEIYLSCAERIFDNIGDKYSQGKSSAKNIIINLPRQTDIDIDFFERYKHEKIKTVYMKDIYEHICKKTNSKFVIDKILAEKDLYSLITLAYNENVKKVNFEELLNCELERLIEKESGRWEIDGINKNTYGIIEKIINRHLPISDKAKYDIINYSCSDILSIRLLNDGEKIDLNKFDAKQPKSTVFVHIMAYLIKRFDFVSFDEQKERDNYIKKCLLNMCEYDYDVYEANNTHFILKTEAPICESDDVYKKILDFTEKIKYEWRNDEIFERMHSLRQERDIDEFFSEFENTIRTAREMSYIRSSFPKLFAVKEVDNHERHENYNSQNLQYEFQIEKLLDYKKEKFKEEIQRAVSKKPPFEWSNFENEFLYLLKSAILKETNKIEFDDDIDNQIYYATTVYDTCVKTIDEIYAEFPKFVSEKSI